MKKMKLIAALLLLQAGLASALTMEVVKLQKGEHLDLDGDHEVVVLPEGQEVTVKADEEVDGATITVKATTIDGALNIIAVENDIVIHALPINLGDSIQLQAGARTIIITVVATTPAVVSPAVAAAVAAAAAQVTALPLPTLPNVGGIVSQLPVAVPSVPALPVAPSVGGIVSQVPVAVPSLPAVPAVSDVVALPAANNVVPALPAVPAVPNVGGVVSTVGGVAAQVPAAAQAASTVSAVTAPVVNQVSSVASSVLPLAAGLASKK